jgi:hypothetical protein
MALFSKTGTSNTLSTMGAVGGIVAAVAPTIATALGGPVAGLAVKALSSLFLGRDNGSMDDITSALSGATPDQLTALKKIDADFKVQMESLNIDLEKIAADDRDSARQMQMSTRDWIPRALALGVTVGFFGILGVMAFHGMPASGNEAFLLLLGSLATSFTSIISFYYGSSSGSRAKDDIIKSMKG